MNYHGMRAIFNRNTILYLLNGKYSVFFNVNMMRFRGYSCSHLTMVSMAQSIYRLSLTSNIVTDEVFGLQFHQRHISLILTLLIIPVAATYVPWCILQKTKLGSSLVVTVDTKYLLIGISFAIS